MSSLREKKKKQNKKAILNAAINLFSRQGYHQTSIEQIAKEAGVGKGTVYSYFQTKKDIIKGFCEVELEHIHQELVDRSDPDEPMVEQLKRIFMVEFRHVTSNVEFGRLFMRESLFPNALETQDNHEMDDKYLELFFPILQKAQARGELRTDLDLLYITAHFYSYYILLLSAWYRGRVKTEEIEQAMDTLFRQALEGLQPKNDAQHNLTR